MFLTLIDEFTKDRLASDVTGHQLIQESVTGESCDRAMQNSLHFVTTVFEPGLQDPDRVRFRVGQRFNGRRQRFWLKPVRKTQTGHIEEDTGDDDEFRSG